MENPKLATRVHIPSLLLYNVVFFLFFCFLVLYIKYIYIYQFAGLSSLPELNLDLESCRNKFGGCLRDKIIWGFLNVSFIRSFERDLSMKLACRTTLELPFFCLRAQRVIMCHLIFLLEKEKGERKVTHSFIKISSELCIYNFYFLFLVGIFCCVNEMYIYY